MKNIFITGANRGIGFELVNQNLHRGNKVWATFREKGNALQLIELEKTSKNLICIQMDVSDEASIEDAAKTISKETKFDILFNNAGIIDWDDFSHVKAKSFADIYQVNVIGVFLVMRHFHKFLVPEIPLSKARIVNLSSRLGSIELRGNTQLGGAIAYQCSKAALNMLSKQASIEFLDKGISVISMSPGWVKTDMGGTDAKYEISESVEMVLSTLDDLPIEKTGIFIGEDGREIAW